MTSQPKLDARDALAILRDRLANGESVSTPARTASTKRHPSTARRNSSSTSTSPAKAATTPTPTASVRTDNRPRPSAPRRPETTSGSALTFGTVTHFNAEKGFGFAYAIVDGKHETVYFRTNHAKKVTGTADNPELTREKHDNVHVLANAGSNNTEIVMVVRPAREEGKKPMAIAWGIRPKRDWRQDAITFDHGYTDFAGGTVAIVANHGSNDVDVEEIRGTIVRVKLTTGELNLVLTDVFLYDPKTNRTSTSDTVAVCYKLKEAYLDGKNERRPESRGRRKVIIAPSMHDKANQVRIIMDKPNKEEQLRAALETSQV